MVKNPRANAGGIRDMGSTCGPERSPGGGQHTPVFLPRESHGQRSLVGYCPWGHKESDMRSDLACTHIQISLFREVFLNQFLSFHHSLCHYFTFFYYLPIIYSAFLYLSVYYLLECMFHEDKDSVSFVHLYFSSSIRVLGTFRCSMKSTECVDF